MRAVECIVGGRTARYVRYATCRAGRYRIYLKFEARRVFCRNCHAVKREALEFLGESPFYTKRLAYYYVGRRCRSTTIKGITQGLRLDWDSGKELDKRYMRVQLARAGTPGQQVIGIDELSICKRHSYRIVVTDPVRGPAIWFGGTERSEASMAVFCELLGAKKSARICLAVMDMWKPFRNATNVHATQAAVLFDKCHVLRRLGEALGKV